MASRDSTVRRQTVTRGPPKIRDLRTFSCPAADESGGRSIGRASLGTPRALLGWLLLPNRATLPLPILRKKCKFAPFAVHLKPRK